jgi:Tfp pilus assembly PilM family ATPase
LQSAMRRFAAGIDVSAEAVRLVVVSRRLRTEGPMRVDCIAAVPLAAGAMAGPEIVDRQAVARALCDVFNGVPAACMSHSLRCSMAIPGSATLTAHLPLNQLAGELVSDLRPHSTSHRSLAMLEPAVLMEAERIAGLERHALAIDWYVDDSPRRGSAVMIAATAREQLEARIECAAMAGITLTAVDGEPHAALRALRHAASFELGLHEPYAAIWVGSDGVYCWRISDDSIAQEVRYPSPEYASVADALRDLADHGVNSCALVGGEMELLEGVFFSLADIGDVLACSVLPFECAPLSDGKDGLFSEHLHEPAFAVAFGLALRGVVE